MKNRHLRTSVLEIPENNRRSLLFAVGLIFAVQVVAFGDHIRSLQTDAIEKKQASWGHWGVDPTRYTAWGSHSNRLIPVYTFGTKGAGMGVDLDDYMQSQSVYRSEEALERLYGHLPADTLNPDAVYLDQTNVADLQRMALAAGKKHLFLVIFDGMDWQTTWAAAIARNNRVGYSEGRGTGLHFQDYVANGTTQFGYMVTSPAQDKATVDVNAQTAGKPSGLSGGYCTKLGGAFPWSVPTDPLYIISANKEPPKHAYTDSASSATSMTAGIKTYNAAINVDVAGNQVVTIAHLAQEGGFSVGAVSSVPISHATPAAAYAHNVSRNDYQDLTRDMLGLASVSHPDKPLQGLDVVIGGGFGDESKTDASQGSNFVSGNKYLAADDLEKADASNGGKYVVALRQEGVDGSRELRRAATEAAESGKRLFGFYGIGRYKGHLPYQTADGDFEPAPGRSNSSETYSKAELMENPTLAEMTEAAIQVLSRNPRGFWLMIEAGDVDWANHDNNLDNSIGAVFSGDDAVRAVTNWVEHDSNWNESLLVVTADHGHYLVILDPESLVDPAAK